MCRFDGRVTARAASSHFPHPQTSLGNLGNALVAVGSFYPYPNLAVEFWEGGRWTRIEDFPHADGKYIASYSTVTVEDTMFLSGEKI